MKIVITGALGHIGSRLIREIPVKLHGSDIHMIDNLSTQRYCSLFNLPDTGHFSFHEKDISKNNIRPIIKGAAVVIHLAAQTYPEESFRKPLDENGTNFNLTKTVAQDCAIQKVPLIFISSTSVYDGCTGEVDESLDPKYLRPVTPYAQSKLWEEIYLGKLAKTKHMRFCVLRFATICGVSPGMRFHTAVNRFCFQTAVGQPVTVWKTAMEQTRPYLDLTDAVSAIITVVQRKRYDGKIFNVVTQHRTVQSILNSIRNLIPDMRVSRIDSKSMTTKSFTVSTKLLNRIGWKSEGDIDRCIFETISLFRKI